MLCILLGILRATKARKLLVLTRHSIFFCTRVLLRGGRRVGTEGEIHPLPCATGYKIIAMQSRWCGACGGSPQLVSGMNKTGVLSPETRGLSCC